MDFSEVSFIQCPSLAAAVYLLSLDTEAFIEEGSHEGHVYWKFRGTPKVREGVDKWKENPSACMVPASEYQELLSKLGYSVRPEGSTTGRPGAARSRRGGSRVRLSDEVLQYIEEAVRKQPEVSPAALKAAIEDKFRMSPSYQTVRNRIIAARDAG